ncbi:MAG: hypothetical protein ABIR56_03570 [Polaromonas sp.]
MHSSTSRFLGRALAATTLVMAALGASHGQTAPLKNQPWPQHGRDAGEQRFSPLAQVDRANVDKLGLAWSYQFRQPRGVEATPIAIANQNAAPRTIFHSRQA